jgi:hypothetical protein
LAFNNFVLFDRVHLPIIGKRAGRRGRGGFTACARVRPRKDRCGDESGAVASQGQDSG